MENGIDVIIKNEELEVDVQEDFLKGDKGEKGDTGDTGATGNGIKSITEYYQVSTSNTTVPTTWLTTVPTLTSINKYLWNYETITYTNGSAIDTLKRVIGVYGDKGVTGDKGEQGPQGIQGIQGEKGDKGDTGSQGIAGKKGDTGATGNGIQSIILKDGSHLAGQYDTYLITFTNGNTQEFKVYNGKNGEGSGDMSTDVYDTNNNGIVDNAEKVNNHTVNSDVPANAIFTDTKYSVVTTSTIGLMSTTDKTKLDGIETGANNYSLPTASSSTLGGVKTTSTVTSNSGYTACPIISGVPYYKDTKYSVVTTSTIGLMSTTDKTKLDGIETGANKITVDSVLSSTSTNPVQNKIVNSALAGKANASHGRHVPDVCNTITDWNSATTNGYYMALDASNAPAAGVWYFGYVIAHNANYVYQEVYQFTASTDAKAITKYIRAKMKGTWGAWTNVTVAKAVPSNAVFTDTNTTYSVATTSANGLMSSSDKNKLDGIATGATKNTVENVLTSASTTNALSAYQGKVLNDKYNGTVLYSNSSGTTGTVTLSESASNFSYLEIFYNKSGIYNSTMIQNPNEKKVNLQAIFKATESIAQIKYQVCTVNDTSITQSGGWLNFVSNAYSGGTISGDTSIAIVKVIGYR